jgi:hypothetical protein
MRISKGTMKTLYNEKGFAKQEKEQPALRSSAPLSLVPESPTKDELENRKKSVFQLPVVPGCEDSKDVKFALYHLDGTESLRETIKWFKDVQRVVKALTITDPTSAIAMITDLLEGAALAAFQNSLRLL